MKIVFFFFGFLNSFGPCNCNLIYHSLLIRMPLQRSGKDFTIMKVLPSGVYQYRFIVDGQWRYAPDMPWDQDETGNAYNILDLQVISSFL